MISGELLIFSTRGLADPHRPTPNQYFFCNTSKICNNVHFTTLYKCTLLFYTRLMFGLIGVFPLGNQKSEAVRMAGRYHQTC